ncbi:hypothetical protein M758_1G018400 [Ceratodon purpureus]|uniref:Uncharacterized protein n=1 Tax=Ceratodon purpureus TaxID=3225 RepID=A0A8T0J3G6_CERPU|nr:hypothetical protein KC19_1G019200 [Ceratodon purpureus]KAG0628329.1 hypothetical protein M758_1G018400 [Ceratodon purpureus]
MPKHWDHYPSSLSHKSPMWSGIYDMNAEISFKDYATSMFYFLCGLPAPPSYSPIANISGPVAAASPALCLACFNLPNKVSETWRTEFHKQK